MDSLASNQFVLRSLASVMVLSVAYIIVLDSCVGKASWESVSIFKKNRFDFVCIFLLLEFVLMKKAPVNGVFNQQFTHFTLYSCLLALRQMSSKTEFKAGSMMVRYNVVSWLEYASISNMWAMTLMHKNKIKLLGGMIILEVIECFITVVFEVGSACL
jgi:hypothetical protein